MAKTKFCDQHRLKRGKDCHIMSSSGRPATRCLAMTNRLPKISTNSTLSPYFRAAFPLEHLRFALSCLLGNRCQRLTQL